MGPSRSDGFAWGAADGDGIALGLDVDASTGLHYRIAVANRSTEPRRVVLFAALDNTYRTRIVARQGDTMVARPAVKPAVAVANNIRIVVELAPGEVLVRDGAPASFGLTGEAALHLVVGGTPAHADELTSGEVVVSLDT